MKSKKYRLIKDLIIFGGNRQNEDGPLITFCLEARKLGYSLFAFVDPFHFNLPTKNKFFYDLLDKNNIEHKVVTSLESKSLKNMVGVHTLGISINVSQICNSIHSKVD